MTGPPPVAPEHTGAPPATARAARIAGEHLSQFASRFTSATLEAEFRQASGPEWAKRVRVVAIVAAVLIIGFSWVDYRALGWGSTLVAMWSLRLAVAGSALFIGRALARPGSAVRHDTAALALMLLLAALVLTIVYVERKGAALETPPTLLAVITFYVFIPTRFAFQLGGGVSLSVLFLWAQHRWGPPAQPEWLNAAVQLLVCNALGVHAALRNHAAARREFLSLRQELRHKRESQESVAALEKSNAELEQFAYVASHDLQSPLRSVISFGQLLQRRHGAALGDKGGEYLATLLQSAGHMQDLISDLLAFSRVGRGGPAVGPVDMEVVLAEVEQALGPRIRGKGAQVTHKPLPVVTGTPTELRQLLQNLLDNALKFQPDGAPQVHISARPAGAFWEFAVRDNGIGIRPDHQNRIFKMFERLHDSQAYEGTGIGLAICRKIVEQHGGRIAVESSPGQGATFRFTLPQHAPAQKRSAPRPARDGLG